VSPVLAPPVRRPRRAEAPAVLAAASPEEMGTVVRCSARLGGPQGFEDALRATGVGDTDPARVEPLLDEGTPGDVGDTSTPRALASGLGAYAVGNALDVQEPAHSGGAHR
jgi:hypothetical protein